MQQRYKLKGSSFISKVGAAWLLVLLMLSITPKSYLHEALAGHKDAESCNDTKVNGPCIHNAGYSCQQADLVVPGAFTVEQNVELTYIPVQSDEPIPAYSFSPSKKFNTYSAGRAPPALV